MLDFARGGKSTSQNHLRAGTLAQGLTGMTHYIALIHKEPGERPSPRSLDELRRDPEFLRESADAVVAAIAPAPGMDDAA